MGWIIIDKPGYGTGPCEKPCKHTDCAESRRDAKEVCHYCGKPIGYDSPFYNELEAKARSLVHRTCLMKESCKRQKKS